MVSTNLGGGHHGGALHRSGSQPNPRPQEQWPQHVPRGSEARAGATVSAARRVAGGDRSGSWPEPQPAGGHGTALAASGGGEDPGPDGSPWTVAVGAGGPRGHDPDPRKDRRRVTAHGAGLPGRARVIGPPSGTAIWIAAGVTDMRRG